MIRLNPTAQDRVIDLGGGVELTCAPLTSAIFAAARNDPAVIAMVTAGAGAEEATLATIKAVARRVIKDWNGVGDVDGRCRTTLAMEDSQRESIWLDGVHEQTITRPLPHYELAHLHGGAPQARVAADLAGQGDGLACAA